MLPEWAVAGHFYSDFLGRINQGALGQDFFDAVSVLSVTLFIYQAE